MSGKDKQLVRIEDLDAPAFGRGRSDPLLPMINVVFLLLTFFLLVCALRIGTAANILSSRGGTQIATQGGAVTLQIEANGVLHFEGRTMPVSEAVAAIRVALDATPHGSLDIQADRSTPASTILPLLRKLQDGGVAFIRLVPVRHAGPA